MKVDKKLNLYGILTGRVIQMFAETRYYSMISVICSSGVVPPNTYKESAVRAQTELFFLGTLRSLNSCH